MLGVALFALSKVLAIIAEACNSNHFHIKTPICFHYSVLFMEEVSIFNFIILIVLKNKYNLLVIISTRVCRFVCVRFDAITKKNCE